MQVHDEIIVECPDSLAEDVVTLLRDAMENTVTLPGVKLLAEPKIGKNLAELK
jgi:DNA polymerase I-like protein with 3'-5' exonuclease and polymerase domains